MQRNYNELSSKAELLHAGKAIIYLIYPLYSMLLPVNCKMSEWGQCSAPCGPGTQKRTVLTEASYEGQACPSQRTRNCELRKCAG